MAGVRVVGVVLGLAAAMMLRQRENNAGESFAGTDSMQAITYDGWGHPEEVLKMSQVPVPSFGSSEVLVKVHAASINPADYKIIQGAFYLAGPLISRRPGFDFCGTVLAVGSKVARLKPGDVVHGMTWFHKTGTLAQFLAVDENVVSVVPNGLPPAEAAALPLVSLTSYASLVQHGGLAAGARVLVLGGSSATGIMAIQLARAYGASVVITTVSPRNGGLVKRLGATHTVNHHKEDVWRRLRESGQQVDIVYDTVGAGRSVWDGAVSGVLAPGGQLVTITGDTQGDMSITELLTRGYHIVSRKLYCLFWLNFGGYHMYTQPSGDAEALDAINRLLVQQKLEAVVHRRFEFDEASVKQAFSELMDGHARGKIVIQISDK